MPNDQSNAEEEEGLNDDNQYGGDSEGEMDPVEQTEKRNANEDDESDDESA